METVFWDNIEDIIIDREEQVRLSHFLCTVVIQKLTPRESALFLSLYDGYACSEIAIQWKVSPQAVSKVMVSLREKIRECLLDSEFAKYVSK